MKRILLTGIVLLFSASFASAQQSINSENVDRFRAISLNGNISAELIASDVNKIEIQLYDSEISRFKWNNKNETLNVNLSSGGKGTPRADVRIYYADTLQYISVSGGQITAREAIESPSLRMDINSGSRAAVKFEVLDLELNVTGNSVAEYSGEAKYLYIRGTEKSKVNARLLEATSVEADAATGAELTVNSTERLVVNAKTTATIFYRGTPLVIKDRTSKMNSGLMGSSVQYIGE